MKAQAQKVELTPKQQKDLLPNPLGVGGLRPLAGIQLLGTFRTTTEVEEPEVKVASEGDRVVAIWRAKEQLQVAVSTDGGSRYTVTALSVGAMPGSIEGFAWQPQVALGDGFILIAYVQRRHLLVQTSTDGSRFSPPVIVASNLSEQLNRTVGERYPLLAYSDGGFGIVWLETVGMQDQVKFARLEPRNFARQSVPEGGARLSSVPLRRLTLTPTTLSRAEFSASAPQILVSGRELRVFFTEDQNPEYVLAMAASHDGGRTFDTLASAAEGDSGLLGERRRKGTVGSVTKPLTEQMPFKFAAPVLLPGRGEFLPTRLKAYRNGVPLWVLAPESAAQGLFRGRLRNLVIPQTSDRPEPEARREERRFERSWPHDFQVVPSTAGAQVFYVDGWENPTRQLTRVWTSAIVEGRGVSPNVSFSDEGMLSLGSGVSGEQAVLLACQKTAEGFALRSRWVRGANPLGDWQLVTSVPGAVTFFLLTPTTRGMAALWLEGLKLQAAFLPAPRL